MVPYTEVANIKPAIIKNIISFLFKDVFLQDLHFLFSIHLNIK